MPGATQAPTPASSDPNSADSFVFGDFPSSSPTGKPSTAFTGQYGPLSAGEFKEYTTGRSSFFGTPLTQSVADLSNEFYGWDQKKKDQFRATLGLINKSALTATDDELAQTWGSYVQQSANYYATGKTVSPDDILSRDVAALTAQRKSLAGTKSSTTIDTQLTGKADADSIFNSAAKSLLGRAPTQAEYSAFQASLNSAERANPTQATTTTTTDEEGNVVNQSRTSTGGIGAGGAQLLAQQEAQKNPEYGAYQAATTYWDAAMQMIQRGY